MSEFHEFGGVLNKTHYYAYDKNFAMKPTGFMSNAQLSLKTCTPGERAEVVIGRKRGDGRKEIKTYNERSDIPEELVKDILEQLMNNPVVGLKNLGEN